jgi:hypothetical protein
MVLALHLAQRVMVTTTLVAVAVVIGAAATVLDAERNAPNSNITTGGQYLSPGVRRRTKNNCRGKCQLRCARRRCLHCCSTHTRCSPRPGGTRYWRPFAGVDPHRIACAEGERAERVGVPGNVAYGVAGQAARGATRVLDRDVFGVEAAVVAGVRARRVVVGPPDWIGEVAAWAFTASGNVKAASGAETCPGLRQPAQAAPSSGNARFPDRSAAGRLGSPPPAGPGRLGETAHPGRPKELTTVR